MNKKISLPDVTLIAATSIEADQAQLALAISSENALENGAGFTHFCQTRSCWSKTYNSMSTYFYVFC